MVKFVNIVDGSVFYAEPGTIQFKVLNSDKNYKIVKEEEKPTKEKAAK